MILYNVLRYDIGKIAIEYKKENEGLLKI